MTRITSSLILTVCISGCAESYLVDAEQTVNALAPNQVPHLSGISSLSSLSNHAALLSDAYRSAATEIAFAQDATAFLTLAAAASTAVGAAEGVGNKTLGRRATAGLSTSLLGGRYFGSDTINSIYSASKRLNCISTVSALAATHAPTSGADNFTAPAVVATRGAIRQVQISARQDVTREAEDFNSLFSSFQENLNLDRTSGGSTPDYIGDLSRRYIADLQGCLTVAEGQAPNVIDPTSGVTSPTDPTGRVSSGEQTDIDITGGEPLDESS